MTIQYGNDDLNRAEKHFDYPEEITWKLKDGTLTIRGLGPMEDYTEMGAPWYKKRSSIKKVVIEWGITRIGNNAFEGSSRMTSIEIPDSVVTIGDSACFGCLSLKTLTLPEGVVSTGLFAFDCCDGLKTISLPASFAQLGWLTFNRCRSVERVEVAPGNAFFCSVDGILFNKAKTELILYPAKKAGSEYRVPDGVTHIADTAFLRCTNLKKVFLPSGVQRIGSWAFGDCFNLSSVTIPTSVNYISTGAFNNCTHLKNYYYTGSEQQWKQIHLEDDNEELTKATIHYNS